MANSPQLKSVVCETPPKSLSLYSFKGFKTNFMTITEKKAQIHDYLEQVDDNFVEAIHTLFNAHLSGKAQDVIGYKADGTPSFSSVEEMKAELDRRVESVKNGNYFTFDELKKRSDAWLKKKSIG